MGGWCKWYGILLNLLLVLMAVKINNFCCDDDSRVSFSYKEPEAKYIADTGIHLANTVQLQYISNLNNIW